jgi:hypothetical protein
VSEILSLTTIILTIIILVKLFIKKRVFLKSIGESKNIPSQYKLKNTLMNKSELALYINLEAAFRDSHLVFSKVRIEDFVEVRTDMHLSRSEIFGLRGKIKSRHVDFLICEINNIRPIVAIELDGYSHNHPRAIERDKFVDELYSSIGLEVVHVRVGSDFSMTAQDIKSKINGEVNSIA